MSDTKEKKQPPHGPQAYRGNGKHEWEPVSATFSTHRLRVPSGWVYKTYQGSMCFVPLPEVVGYKI